MKLTIFSDTHGNFKELKKIDNKENLFFLGDVFTNKNFVKLIGQNFVDFYRKRADKEKLIQDFLNVKDELSKCKMNKQMPLFFRENKIFILPGNHETTDFYNKLKNMPNLLDIHLKKISIGGFEIIGHGGIISPSQIIYSENFFIYPDEMVAKNLIDLNPSKGCIILMHELPIEFYSPKTRKAIEKIKPRMVIGGHNHGISKKKFEINGIKYFASGMGDEFMNLDL